MRGMDLSAPTTTVRSGQQRRRSNHLAPRAKRKQWRRRKRRAARLGNGIKELVSFQAEVRGSRISYLKPFMRGQVHAPSAWEVP